tara:strand:+ start:4676 stop:5071 length:396 start_codon:yes stop_codon:yes gene_type:complete
METLYTEIFYDVKKNKSITQIKDELSNIAETYGAEDNYNIHEMEGTRKTITKDILISVFLFNSSNLSNYIDFLKYIKTRNYLHVNVIYYNNETEKLIYNIDKNKKDIVKNKIEKKDTSDTNFIKEIITPLL